MGVKMTNRRSVLRGIGLVSTGLCASLLAHPAASAVDASLAPNAPIKDVSVDNGSLHVDLVEHPQLSLIRIIGPDDEVLIEDWIGDMDLKPPVGQSGTYRVIAYRGDYVDPERVQIEHIEVNA